MKILAVLALMLCAAFPAMADVTKDDVKKLINAGVSEQVIINYVRANGPVIMTSADLGELKTLGASDNVLNTLVAGMQYQRPQTTVVVESEPVYVYSYWPSYWYFGYYGGCRPYYYRPYYYRPVVVQRPIVRPVIIRPVTPRVVRHR